MRELTVFDFELISGGVGPVGAALGGVTAGAQYIGYGAARGEGSFIGLVGSVAGGAALGFVAGPAGVGAMQIGASAIVGAQVGMYSGMAGGYIQNALEAAGTNYGAGGTNYN
ncbi:hypothetical protein D3C76_355760 [compost metagenome]